jgi:ATP-binding cassette subfamily B (MDR/TAP) protein 1
MANSNLFRYFRRFSHSVLDSISHPLVSTASDALTLSLRRTYITSVLAQDPSFFDTHGPGEVASRAGKDISTIRSAFGEKMGYVFWSAGTLLASIIPSFILAARLSGILIGIIPFTLLIILISSYLIHSSSTPISALEGRSSSLIEQILSSIRIAQTFSMEPHLVSKLDSRFLSKLEKLGKPRALARAFEQAGVYFSLFLTFSLGFWASGIEVVGGVEVGYAMTVSMGDVDDVVGDETDKMFAVTTC